MNFLKYILFHIIVHAQGYVHVVEYKKTFRAVKQLSLYCVDVKYTLQRGCFIYVFQYSYFTPFYA